MKSLNSFIENYSILDRLLTFENKVKQDGPSLESSSYLNVTLRYLGPWDLGTHGPMELGTPGPWTFGLLDVFPPPISFSFEMVWYRLLDYNLSSGPFLSYEIEIGDGPVPELDNKLCKTFQILQEDSNFTTFPSL